MKRRELENVHCTVARSAAELVDAWTFVILREIFLGNRSFEGIRRQSGMSPRSLALRLQHLVASGILASDDSARSEYRPTRKGEGLWPVLVSLKQWGDEWLLGGEGAEPPLGLVHRGHDHALKLLHVCEDCGEPVDARSATPSISAQWARERATMETRNQRRSASK